VSGAPGGQVRAVLGGLSLFSSLDEEALGEVAGRTLTRAVGRGALLFREGQPCRGLYVVTEGRINVYRASPDGREQVLHAMGPGQPVAEVPLFDGGPYPASARAVEDSRVLFLPIDAFRWLYTNNPAVADAVIHELGRRLRRMVRLVEHISLKDVPARVAAALLDYAEAAGPLREGRVFELPRTQEQWATELATTRESVARALAGLRREGTISQEGRRIAIRDLARLASHAQRGRKD
jgi:CRP-like cAMP-binding protein